MNWLEKLVLLATFSMFLFLGVAAWLIQGQSRKMHRGLNHELASCAAGSNHC